MRVRNLRGKQEKVFVNISAELLQSGYGVRFRPGGFSMSPTIRDGEVLTVKPIKACAVKRGDILLYKTERGAIAHRVVGIKVERGVRVFILRGDALGMCDAPVRAKQILGHVISVERKGREVKLSGRCAVIRCAARALAARLKRGLRVRLSLARPLF
jgi:signal peptidase I